MIVQTSSNNGIEMYSLQVHCAESADIANFLCEERMLKAEGKVQDSPSI